jgi:hypothetical protein
MGTTQRIVQPCERGRGTPDPRKATASFEFVQSIEKGKTNLANGKAGQYDSPMGKVLQLQQV